MKKIWTKEQCRKEALKYNTRQEFKKGSAGARCAAQQNGWMNEICSHMTRSRKPNGFWTKEACRKEAKKYQTRTEFRNGSASSHTIAYRNGWLDDIRRHMISGHYISKWNYENCAKEAKKYESRSAFKKGSNRAYVVSRENDWMDNICTEMRVLGSKHERATYALVFRTSRAVYVGLSYDPLGERLKKHLEDSCNKNLAYQLSVEDCEIIVFEGMNSKYEAGMDEQTVLDHFDAEGWEIFNSATTGALGGGNLKWDKEACRKEAKKYQTRTEFRNGSASAYSRAGVNGWLVDICNHMGKRRRRISKWTLELCRGAASKYKSRAAFKKGSNRAYVVSRKNDWLNSICDHMISNRKPDGYWDKEACRDEAAKWNTITEFRRNAGSAYNTTRKNGWFDEFFPK